MFSSLQIQSTGKGELIQPWKLTVVDPKHIASNSVNTGNWALGRAADKYRKHIMLSKNYKIISEQINLITHVCSNYQ